MDKRDLFGGFHLGDAFDGLLDGLARSGIIPKDTPEGKILAVKSELSDLKRKESELLLEIGRQAYDKDPASWSQDAQLRTIKQSIEAAQGILDEVKQAQERYKAERADEYARGRCGNCGYKNPAEVKFCHECGSPLGAPEKAFCTSCGAELTAGVRFCGACGARQG